MPKKLINPPFILLLILGLCQFAYLAKSQNFAQDSSKIRQIYDLALDEPQGYEWLRYLCYNIGGRVSGSPEAAAAVEFTRQILDTLGADRVFLQEVEVPYWVRGAQEKAFILDSPQGKIEVPVCALGNSVGTGTSGVTGQIIEVKTFEELAELGEAKVKGKIVFFNRPMNSRYVSTFRAYGEAANQRFSGASEAAKYGAIGVVVRSLSSSTDDYPHTGSLGYQFNLPKLPAIAISTKGADLLSRLLKNKPDLSFYFETHCQNLPDVMSYNVVAELKGSQFPEEIIAVGGHLDAWDLGQGAHDDGAGCVQSIEVLRIFKALGIRPKRTIRVVMFMNEENGLRGGRKYAELAEKNKEKHIAALESDAGGFTPRGIGINENSPHLEKIMAWQNLFAPYQISLQKGGGGADISPLLNQGVTLMSLNPDSQRYFDYHHSSQDTFDKVNWRELQLGAAAMASIIYLISEYGL